MAFPNFKAEDAWTSSIIIKQLHIMSSPCPFNKCSFVVGCNGTMEALATGTVAQNGLPRQE